LGKALSPSSGVPLKKLKLDLNAIGSEGLALIAGGTIYIIKIIL